MIARNAIRVAFSGSGFKFPAHVGALAAINDAGYTPIEYAGTSGGSIIAALAASGMSIEEMKALTMTRDWSDMLTFNLWSLVSNMGYCTGDVLLNWIEAMTGGKTFKDLPTRLVIMASDITNEKPFEFSLENTPDITIAEAARASAAIPLVYAPVKIGAALLMDGGMCNNIPIDKLTIDEVPRIGIQLVSQTSDLHPGSYSIFDIVPRLIQMMMSANENTHIDLGKYEGASFSFVESGFAGSLDKNMSTSIRSQLFDIGYSATKQTLSTLKPLPVYPQAAHL